jgi:serine protease Do
VGFAIPGQDAKKALESYKKFGKISRPFIGVRYIMLSKTLAEKEQLSKDYGALLIRGDTTTDFAVVPGSPADKAGLKENDIILEINGVELKKDKTLAGCQNCS